MSTVDDVHAKLVRAIETQSDKGIDPRQKEAIGLNLVRPLALASIALELGEMRHAIAGLPDAISGAIADGFWNARKSP